MAGEKFKKYNVMGLTIQRGSSLIGYHVPNLWTTSIENSHVSVAPNQLIDVVENRSELSHLIPRSSSPCTQKEPQSSASRSAEPNGNLRGSLILHSLNFILTFSLGQVWPLTLFFLFVEFHWFSRSFQLGPGPFRGFVNRKACRA